MPKDGTGRDGTVGATVAAFYGSILLVFGVAWRAWRGLGFGIWMGGERNGMCIVCCSCFGCYCVSERASVNRYSARLASTFVPQSTT